MKLSAEFAFMSPNKFLNLFFVTLIIFLTAVTSPATSFADDDDDDAPVQLYLTYYWSVFEGDYVQVIDTNLYRQDGSVIDQVPYAFAQALAHHGNGYLENNELVTDDGWCSVDTNFERCYSVVDNTLGCQFGVGAEGNCLVPFRSVSVSQNMFDADTRLYVPELDGVILPNGSRHNGCVFVDDDSAPSNQMSLFIEKEDFRDDMNTALGQIGSVHIIADSSRCR